MVKKKHTRTSDRDLYSKLQTLRITNEVLISIDKKNKIKRILKNLNKSNKIIDSKEFGNFIQLKKINSEDFEVYSNF